MKMETRFDWSLSRKITVLLAALGLLLIAVTVVAALVVLVPGAPLIAILVLTQVLNAVLLLPLLAFMYGIARDRDLMGEHTASRALAASYLLGIGFILVCVVALFTIEATG